MFRLRWVCTYVHRAHAGNMSSECGPNLSRLVRKIMLCILDRNRYGLNIDQMRFLPAKIVTLSVLSPKDPISPLGCYLLFDTRLRVSSCQGDSTLFKEKGCHWVGRERCSILYMKNKVALFQQLILWTTKQFVLDNKAYWRLRQVWW